MAVSIRNPAFKLESQMETTCALSLSTVHLITTTISSQQGGKTEQIRTVHSKTIRFRGLSMTVQNLVRSGYSMCE